MPENTIHTLTPKDVENYLAHRCILAQLSDIFTKCDMDDELVMPDYFIPLAERHGFITALSEIILSKTCRQIKALLDDGYNCGAHFRQF